MAPAAAAAPLPTRTGSAMALLPLDGLPAEQVTRELYFNVGGPHGPMRLGIYPLFALALAYLGWRFAQRLRVWRRGRPEVRSDQPLRRLGMVARYVLGQGKVLRERYAGWMHAALFYGFLVLFGVTLVIMVQEDLTEPLFGATFLHGGFYLVWSAIAELGGVALLLGVGMAAWRRYGRRPERLDNRPEDLAALLLLAFLGLSGFLLEALRIALTGMPPFEVWSGVGYLLAHLVQATDPALLRPIHRALWWLHLAAAFTLVAQLASGRFAHILFATLNVYFGPLEDESPAGRYRLPLIDPREFEEAERFGAETASDLTWKERLDGDACTRCGRCQDRCPAWATEKPLSPKGLTLDLAAAARAEGEEPPLVGGAVAAEAVWACTNCAACQTACPVNIQPIPKILAMRRAQVLMAGEMAPELQRTFLDMENHLNPYGFAAAERAAWLPEGVPVRTLAEDPEVDLLYFVGCAASYDKRNQPTARAVVRLLARAGVKVGILGPEEVCCGDAALRAGNEYLFQVLAGQNLETFARYGVRRIVVSCPHGYNVLRKEYPRLAALLAAQAGEAAPAPIEVVHHTQLLAELVAEGRLRPRAGEAGRVTFHDPCFLVRYNDGDEPPRALLRALPGSRVVEMGRSRKESFCCGAGGGRMWLEERIGSRINQARTREAAETGAATVATGCPFCHTMLADGTQDLSLEGLAVRDVAELLLEAVEGEEDG